MVEDATMTPDEVVEWLEGMALAGQPSLGAADIHADAAETVAALRDAAKEAQGVLADLTGANPARSVLNLWARAVAAETALRSSLSPKEGKT